MIRPIRAAAMLLLFIPLLACADEVVEQTYTAGKDYAVLDQPMRTRDTKKVEVVEVFWYGCPHCFHFEPLVSQWKKSLPSDVDFWTSPAMWDDDMETHARIFYTANALGVLDKIHTPLFTAMVVERKPMTDTKAIEDFFAGFGVERETFRKVFNSFGVTSQIKQANARARGYKISGTPELVVNGKYRISARMAGGQAEMLKVADFLIAKERQQTAPEQ